MTKRLWLNVLNGCQKLGDQWLKVFDSVAHSVDHQNGDWQCCQVLLKLEVLVHRQKDIESCRRERQETAILDACPATTR